MSEATGAGVAAGVIGLGMMGAGIAQALDAAGLLTAVHDVRPGALDELPQLVDRRKASAADVARATDVVMIVVLDLDQVEQVIFGPGGLAEGTHPDLVACICATVDVEGVRQVAARAADVGVTVVDVGIAGGPPAAAAGGLLTTTGADDATFARILPCLDAMSVTALHGGPVGAGMQLKIIKNALSYLTMCSVHEVLLLAEELGFSSEVVGQVATDSNLLRDFFWFPIGRPSARPFDPDTDAAAIQDNRHFAALARKDLAAAAAVADSVGMDHPVIDLATRQVDRYFLLPDD